VEVNDIGKHSSLLRYGRNYDRKSFMPPAQGAKFSIVEVAAFVQCTCAAMTQNSLS